MQRLNEFLTWALESETMTFRLARQSFVLSEHNIRGNFRIVNNQHRIGMLFYQSDIRFHLIFTQCNKTIDTTTVSLKGWGYEF